MAGVAAAPRALRVAVLGLVAGAFAVVALTVVFLGAAGLFVVAGFLTI